MTERDSFQKLRRYLMPLPRHIRPSEGSFSWSNTVSFELWAELSPRSRMHLTEFGQHLEKELGIIFEEAPPEQEQEPQVQIYLHPLIPPGFRESDFPTADGELVSDSCLLAVGNRITLWAGGAPGLFYGLETLAQLFRAGSDTRAVPGVVIRDLPAFPHRMVQYDIAREQTVQMEYLKRVIRRLASLKVNQVMLYLEYRYQWKSHPAFGPPGALTAEQARELTAYADSYCIDLIPQVNVLGHVEGFLGHSEYAHLREVPENPFQLCPLNPAAFDLFEVLIEEMLPQFASDFFHVGGDESFLLGKCPRCREKAEQHGMAALYADHMVRFHELLSSHGKRMMMWGDIILQHPDIAERLPKDIVIFDWHYHGSSPETLDFFRDKGFDVYAASSLGGYESNRFIPPWDRGDRNTGPFFRDAAARSIFGACFTTWEMFFGNLFQNNWYPVIYGACAAWNPEESSEGGLADRFGEAFMGDPRNACVEILRILGHRLHQVWKGFAGESSAQRIRAVFFDPNPLHLGQLVAAEITDDQLARIDGAVADAFRMLEMARRGKVRNPDLLEWLDFVIHMHQSVTLRIRSFRQVREHYMKAQELAANGSPRVVSAISSCITILQEIRCDLDYYMTKQASAVERYGSTIHDLERYHKQVKNLDEYSSHYLTALESFPDVEIPSVGRVGLE